MDREYSCHRDGKFIIVPPIEELCLELKDKFLRQEEEKKRLIEENKHLKSVSYKDDELRRLKEELSIIEKQNRNGFVITDDELEKINEWKKNNKSHSYTYSFVTTSIGVEGTISNEKNSFVFRELG